ncbi:hypothetical protein Moror_11228 [Moniliophthora roreri MCA 2997]|uniref:Uncharacterized protein n=1 Tax=Moniliophthora roreri (strain MCA 2997) TaxID=1381753 RepID=V2W755_MONRO|nr:hypothetical protein Moror_11228 [Moniliophthora roreri MCA 2997]
MELMKGFTDSMNKCWEEGVVTYNCKWDEECLLLLYPLFFAGNNPMQMEENLMKDLGSYLNLEIFICPKRHLLTFMNKSEELPYSSSDAAIQVVLALGKLMYSQMNELLSSFPINPLLRISRVDIHLDTPMEILHTILLGVVKYYWGQTVVILNKGKYFGLFETRLASIEEGSLKIPKITAEYMCKYKESLIGKHFKSLAQVMPFLVYDLVLKEVLEAWTVIRELVVLVWHVEIKDLEVYLANLSATIEALLNVTSQCLPSILITKLKFHFLVHLSAYIHRFGPPLIFSTERYELFNHVFHLSCTHSNQQAPSKDSCHTFTS